jgi:hypothetical protein
MQLGLIQSRIFELRGLKVRLDVHLAEMYEVQTRMLKQAVKRNINRFPPDFMFQLNKKEWPELITICDNLPKNIKFSPATPFAFTEQGVAMLSSVLNSEKAIEVNIAIIRTFVLIRQYAVNYKELHEKLQKLEKKYNKNFKEIYEALSLLIGAKIGQEELFNREPIGFKTTVPS